ncbi:FAD-binding oxidoreductase [Actinomadura roseirufa]|uniref:FAD-binding oxidoreductase n=1 Tax=Actinomadura roseirufa TaxID=2094049 RepID=UPI001041897A|nr:FAD-linked oxidase C-terminal domain-containing protein [Actinomadura roseirufa]
MGGLLRSLRGGLPAGRLVTDPDVMSGYAHDRARWAPHGTPVALVRAGSAEDVRTVVAACAEHGAPLVPRGAGTGLSGGANALDGCVLLSLEEMDEILEIDPVERLAVVQPGVVDDALRMACAERGLWFPPDPAGSSRSTIGGNVATNAGGVCCVKYGATGDHVLAVEAVVGRGEIVRLGRRTARGVAGYDLCALMVGSEGTLGVVTEVTLRLRSARAPERTIVGYFDDLGSAGAAAAAVTAAGIVPSALELVDRHCLRAVDAWRDMGLSADANVLLLGRTDLPGPAGEEEADAMVRLFRDAGATWSDRSADEPEAESLFTARLLAYPALERLGPVLTEDVRVPRARVAEMLTRIEAASDEHGVPIAIIAHAGDGNLHPLLLVPPDDADARRRAGRAFDRIVADAVALGGTVTGEHGVGLVKRRGLRAEMSPPVLALHRAVKDALDPAGVFNPGKILGEPG